MPKLPGIAQYLPVKGGVKYDKKEDLKKEWEAAWKSGGFFRGGEYQGDGGGSWQGSVGSWQGQLAVGGWQCFPGEVFKEAVAHLG